MGDMPKIEVSKIYEALEDVDRVEVDFSIGKAEQISGKAVIFFKRKNDTGES